MFERNRFPAKTKLYPLWSNQILCLLLYIYVMLDILVTRSFCLNNIICLIHISKTVCLFGVFADVSLHQWARLKTIKSSFQSNPGPTVLGGFRTTRLFDSSHDNVLPCQRWRSTIFLIRKFFCVRHGKTACCLLIETF